MTSCGMRLPAGLLAALLLAPVTGLCAADVRSSRPGADGSTEAFAPVYPLDGAVLTQSIPHFEWQRPEQTNLEAMPDCEVQIATDVRCEKIVDKDRLAAVIGWYVPDRELTAGDYWWRVARVDAGGKRRAWSAARKFTVRQPDRVVKVPANAAFVDIQRAFADAAKATPAVVEFEPGIYRLDPGSVRQFIQLSAVNDLIINGSGANLVFTRPLALVHLEHCRRVIIKNFTFDFDPPAYTAGRVVSLDDRAGTIDAEILPGHALPDASPVFSRDRKGMIVSEAENFAMKHGIQLVVAHSGFERVDGRRYRFRFDRAEAWRLFSVGDIYVLDPRWIDDAGGHGAVVNGGEDVVFFNLAIRSAANECLGSFYADRHAILHVRLERPAGRALSVNNGGNNHHNARTGPWIEGCLFENCGDDVCHVNGYAMAVASQPMPDQLVVSTRQPYDQFGVEARLDFRVGDRMLFYNEKAGRLLAERKVAGFTPGVKSVLLRLDASVSGLNLGRLSQGKKTGYPAMDDTSVTQIFNASRTCSQFVFRNNTARNSRRVGVLAKGDSGLIEGNTFENLGGGGVEFWNAPFEGLAAENYVVRNNRILNCGRLARKHAAIWATMFKTGGDRLHRNLLVERNEITGFPGPAILLRDAENILLRDNRIQVAPSPGEAIVVGNTAAVRQENNSITKQQP